ncbi:hypothetical protein CHARACLAT_018412 [Characodon lateralis]|uniref:Uncharacterized protein n=1 Tax=Characodon lateralis TaxID=208331 RepID=A0ABU7ELJ4_9TELE|nr:hypothetical protein [Characodon lateralis]
MRGTSQKPSWGGIRVLNVSKSSTKKHLKSHAKEMSFPHGESTEGKWEDFIHNVSDFEESELVRVVHTVEVWDVTVLAKRNESGRLDGHRSGQQHGQPCCHYRRKTHEAQAEPSTAAESNHGSSIQLLLTSLILTPSLMIQRSS